MGIIIAILAICTIFLFLPSNRTARIRKANERLQSVFQGPTDADFRPLMAANLIGNDKFAKVEDQTEVNVYVFAPDPKAVNTSVYLNELQYPNSYYNYGRPPVPTLVLLAPDPTSTGWTLFAQVWIARCLQHKNTNDVRNMGQNLAYSGPTAALADLKKSWQSIPLHVQKQADEILATNRAIAKSFKQSRRFYRTSTGKLYEIPDTSSMYDFSYTYNEANPSRQAAQ